MSQGYGRWLYMYIQHDDSDMIGTKRLTRRDKAKTCKADSLLNEDCFARRMAAIVGKVIATRRTAATLASCGTRSL